MWLNDTLVAPLSKLPRMVMVAPTFPMLGRASTNRPSPAASLLEVPIVSLHQRTDGKVAIRALALGAEGVECGEPAARGDFENRATAIGGLDQVTVRVRAIGASAQGAEAVERSESATRGNSEDRTLAVGPAGPCYAIHVPIGGLHHPRLWIGAVSAIEAVQDGQSGGLGERGACYPPSINIAPAAAMPKFVSS